MYQLTGDIIKELPFFDKLTDDDVQKIRQKAIVAILPKGQRIKCYDKDGFGIFYIQKGEVRLFLNSEDRRQITLFSLYAGDMSILSASYVLTPISFESELIIESETVAYMLDVESFKQIIETNAEVRSFIYELLAERFSYVIENLPDILFENIDKRVANFLLKKHILLKVKEMKVTHSEIAVAISSSREVVGKALRKLTQENVIACETGKIIIKDVEKLKQYCYDSARGGGERDNDL